MTMHGSEDELVGHEHRQYDDGNVGTGGHYLPSRFDAVQSNRLRYWVGAAGWAGFALLLVTTLLYTLVLGLRTLSRHRAGSETTTS